MHTVVVVYSYTYARVRAHTYTSMFHISMSHVSVARFSSYMLMTGMLNQKDNLHCLHSLFLIKSGFIRTSIVTSGNGLRGLSSRFRF